MARLTKALLVSAFFVGASESLACRPDRVDARATVEWVTDGDTIRVDGNRPVRLIGLNAPEAAREERPAEVFADEATSELRRLLASRENRVQLRYGVETRDQYGRSLAHVFLPDGISVAAHLLRLGLATSLVVPPNTWNLDCYLRAEREARQARRGVWALPQYQPISATDLPLDTRGFRIVRGRVSRIGESRRAVWINLEDGFAAKIEHQDLPHLGELDPRSLVDRKIEVRGWVYRHRGELRIRLRHSADLKVLD